jgi:hypothetical protein
MVAAVMISVLLVLHAFCLNRIDMSADEAWRKEMNVRIPYSIARVIDDEKAATCGLQVYSYVLLLHTTTIYYYYILLLPCRMIKSNHTRIVSFVAIREE